MLNSIKFLVTLSISALLVLSCSKSDVEPVITTTYKLTLSATPPTSGSTTISYKKADGTTATLTNATTAFSESFTISKGFNIFLNTKGTNNSTTAPVFDIKYAVEKFENNVSKGIICFSGGSNSVFGKAGSWTIDGIINITFDGTDCK